MKSSIKFMNYLNWILLNSNPTQLVFELFEFKLNLINTIILAL